jgi:hypothetical protein
MLSKRQFVIITKKANNTMIGKKAGNTIHKGANETYDKMPKPIVKSQMEK